MPVRVNVHVTGDRELIAAFRGVLRHIENLETVWRIVEPGFRQIMREQFQSEGSAGRSGAWKELSPGYAARKKLQYGDKPILQATGRLESSLTGQTADSFVTVSRKSVGFGTKVPYASAHQQGSKGRNLPRRRIIDMSDEQERFFSSLLVAAVEKDLKTDQTVVKMIDVKK